MTAVTPMLEITDAILEIGGKSLFLCMQCGTCTGVCPWGLVRDFSPRTLLRLVSLGIEGYENEDLWNCVTCANCVEKCPRQIDLIDVMRSARSLMLEEGMAPRGYRTPLGSLKDEGNPWSASRSERLNWAAGLDLPEYGSQTEHLFFACCTHAYDGRNRKALKALASLLLQGKLSMGVIGTEESCCGDQAEKTGALGLYQELSESNRDLFASRGVRSIIATSPHCMNLFNKQENAGYRSVHYTQALDRLIGEGKLKPSKEVGLRVAYHDPCYLGRHNGIYEEPRNVLRAIPGLDFIELPRNRSESLCCGGGGGGIWSEVAVDERFSVLRINEAKEIGAQVIATACPFCTIMLEDGLKALSVGEDEMRVMDIAELLRQSVE